MRRRAESTRCSRATSTFAPDPSHGSKCHHSGPNDTDVPGAPHVIPSASDTDIPGTLLSFRAQARNLRAGLQPPDSSADLGMTDAGNDRGRMTHAVDDTCTEPGAGLLSFRAQARNLRAGLQPPDSSADLGMTDAGNDRGRMTHAVDDTCTEPGAGLLSFRAQARNLRAGLQPPDSSADLGMTDAGNDRGRMTHAVDDTCTEPGAGLLSFRARRHRHSRRSPCHSERKRHGHSGHPTVIPSASEESPRQSPTPRFLGGPRNDRSRDN